ncbi:MAG: NDP-sugar synthase [Acidothermales bacterium]|nr:NDP-sugar synthase [Acidothermales bacterium]
MTAPEAVVLVGGQGTRLRPLTLSTPKQLLPVAGVPLIAHLLARLRVAGVEHVVLATSYRAELFAAALGDGSAFGLELEHVTEAKPLGTGGGVRGVVDRLRAGPDEPVLVLNGDVLSATDPAALVEAHRAAAADVTLELVRVPDPRAFGLVPTEPSGRVTAFLEKPERAEDIVTDQVNAGCYVFRRRVLDRIPAGRPVSVERETFPELLRSGARLHGVVTGAYWRDLGTPADYVRGSCDVVLGAAPSPALPGEPGERLVLAGAQVSPGAEVVGGSVVGAGAVVEAGAVVDGCVLLDGAVVERGASVTGSAVGVGARVGAGTVCADVVLGDGAWVGPDNELRGGLRLWPGARVEAGTVRFSGLG